MSSNEPSRRRLYSEKLVGLKNPNCTTPKCTCWMDSTGWLEEYSGLTARDWCIEFQCPEHGPQLTSGGEWQKLIDNVLRDSGISLSSSPTFDARKRRFALAAGRGSRTAVALAIAIGALAGVFIVRAFFLGPVEEFGWSVFWHGLGQGQLMHMGLVLRSSMLWKCLCGFLVGGAGAAFGLRQLRRK